MKNVFIEKWMENVFIAIVRVKMVEAFLPGPCGQFQLAAPRCLQNLIKLFRF